MCEKIEECIPVNDGRMVRRPFNHYSPALTDWWIVPSLELPFFKFGKYFFSWDEKSRKEIRCGLYLAKGLDPALKKVYPTKKGRRLLMDDSWGWHTFYPAVEAGILQEKVRTGAIAIGRKVELIFEGGYVDDPGLFNPDSDLRKKDRYTLIHDPDDNSIRVLTARRDAMSLKFLNKVRDWKSFSEAMKYLNEEQFMWVDIFIASAWGVCPGVEIPPDAVGAGEIWEKWLSHFRQPLKTIF
jgi:hypothetical protein